MGRVKTPSLMQLLIHTRAIFLDLGNISKITHLSERRLACSFRMKLLLEAIGTKFCEELVVHINGIQPYATNI